MDKIATMAASPEVKEGIANRVGEIIKNDDLLFLMEPMCVFHEGARYDIARLSDGEYQELLELLPNVVIDEEGYINNIEYLTSGEVYHLVKRFGILSFVAKVLEAREVAVDRLWELANLHPEANFELQEALILCGLRAINGWDINILNGEISYILEGQEVTCRLSAKEAKKLLDDWGITALVKELVA